jgi:hypothetical protein
VVRKFSTWTSQRFYSSWFWTKKTDGGSFNVISGTGRRQPSHGGDMKLFGGDAMNSHAADGGNVAHGGQHISGLEPKADL